jgi:fatty acid desaturase
MKKEAAMRRSAAYPLAMEVADGAGAGGVNRRNPYRRYRSTLLSSQRVREFSRLRPWRSVRDTAWMWMGILLAWAVVFIFPTWWAAAAAIPVIGTRYYGLFIIGHDGMHRRIFASGPASDLFTDVFLIGPIGMCNRVNSRPHLEHHQHLANDEDPDLHKHACFNKASRLEYVLFLTGLASVITVFRTLFLGAQRAAVARPAAGADAESAGPVKRAHRARDLVIIAAWQALLLGGLTSMAGTALGGRSVAEIVSRGWWAYPALWVLPVYAFTYLPNLIRSFVEHSHPEEDDVADEHRLVTFLSNPVERLFLAPMNMNYHITHHLWPSIPYYNLPEADAEVRGRPAALREGLSWRRTYVGYLWRYYVALPLVECRGSRLRDGTRTTTAGAP